MKARVSCKRRRKKTQRMNRKNKLKFSFEKSKKGETKGWIGKEK
jgi:hypothetical protein